MEALVGGGVHDIEVGVAVDIGERQLPGVRAVVDARYSTGHEPQTYEGEPPRHRDLLAVSAAAPESTPCANGGRRAELQRGGRNLPRAHGGASGIWRAVASRRS